MNTVTATTRALVFMASPRGQRQRMADFNWDQSDVLLIDDDVETIVSFLSSIDEAEQAILSSEGRVRFNGSARLSDAVGGVIQADADTRMRYGSVDNLSYHFALYETLMVAYSEMRIILENRTESALRLLDSNQRNGDDVMDAITHLSICEYSQICLRRLMSSLAWETGTLR